MNSPLRAQAARDGWKLLPYQAERHTAKHRLVIGDIFSCTVEEADRWVEVAGSEKIRVLECEGEYAGTALLMPMHQFFGGKRVQTRGAAGVGVLTPYRRDGVGSLLMAECLREMESAGDACANLYASTTKLYRGVGYEMAGTHYSASLETSYLPASRSELEVRALSEADRPAMQAIVQANAALAPGHLDRCEYIWPRLLRPRGKDAQAYGVFDANGRMRGFLAFNLEHGEDLDDFQRMTLRVFEAADAEGLQGLMTLLRSHHSMVREMVTTLPPQSPFWTWLPEQRAKTRMREHFMLRIVRMADALQQRGYPLGMHADLIIEIDDPVLPANQGLWRLQLADGEPTVSKLNAIPDQACHHLGMDIGAFAALYSGHQPAENLVILGRAEGGVEALARASAAFSSRAVTCPEMF
jgi:predicted acetyltransferase